MQFLIWDAAKQKNKNNVILFHVITFISNTSESHPSWREDLRKYNMYRGNASRFFSWQSGGKDKNNSTTALVKNNYRVWFTPYMSHEIRFVYKLVIFLTFFIFFNAITVSQILTVSNTNPNTFIELFNVTLSSLSSPHPQRYESLGFYLPLKTYTYEIKQIYRNGTIAIY